MIYLLALMLSGVPTVALIATALTLLSSRLGTQAGMAWPESMYHFALMLYVTLLVLSWQGRSNGWAFASGAALGLAVLFEPVAAGLAPLSALQLLLGRNPRASGLDAMRLCAAFLAGVVGTAVGLFALGGTSLIDPQSVLLHFASHFSQRASYIGIARETWLASLVLPTPFIGTILAEIVSAADVRKLAIGAVDGSLSHRGLTVILSDALAKGGGIPSAAIGILWQQNVAARPAAYLVSIPTVAMRGLWGGAGIVGLIGIFHVRRMLQFARADGRLGVHLTAILPIFALLLLNTLLTHNSYWLNPMIAFAYAYAIAYVACGW